MFMGQTTPKTDTDSDQSFKRGKLWYTLRCIAVSFYVSFTQRAVKRWCNGLVYTDALASGQFAGSLLRAAITGVRDEGWL